MATGALHANENYLFCKDELCFAYGWLSGEMADCIDQYPIGVHYPMWLWYQWKGCHKRPDMRTLGQCHAAKGMRVTLMVAEIPDNMVLWSDVDLWHIGLK